mmetsp:Transcript_28691/g.73975  ORF Transcript_28691/g.73975 Transcript_28691/m.73975 type:complete len:287 (-) Transcript_28691:192-1052(-)|eukprot:scaffold116900_cov17-Tisochrysis_lutea.AAC.1
MAVPHACGRIDLQHHCTQQRFLTVVMQTLTTTAAAAAAPGALEPGEHATLQHARPKPVQPHGSLAKAQRTHPFLPFWCITATATSRPPPPGTAPFVTMEALSSAASAAAGACAVARGGRAAARPTPIPHTRIRPQAREAVCHAQQLSSRHMGMGGTKSMRGWGILGIVLVVRWGSRLSSNRGTRLSCNRCQLRRGCNRGGSISAGVTGAAWGVGVSVEASLWEVVRPEQLLPVWDGLEQQVVWPTVPVTALLFLHRWRGCCVSTALSSRSRSTGADQSVGLTAVAP